MLDGPPSGAEEMGIATEVFRTLGFFTSFIANQAYPALIGVTQSIALPIACLRSKIRFM